MSYQILMLVILGSLYATASPTCSNPTVTPSRNTWALDYTGQLYSGYFCVTGSPKTLAWSFLDLSGTTLAFFTFTTNFGSNPCQPATPVPGYNATCQYKGSCYTTTFSVTNKLTSSFNQSTLYLIHSGSSCFAQNISLQACSSPTPNNVPINPSSGVYNTQANFQCSHGLSLFYLNGTTGNTATKCFATSEWENENIVQCWSAPTATLIGNNTICAGNIATFQCTASGGVPSWDRVEVYFNNQNQTLVGNTWTSNPLSSSNNGDIVECRAINSYTAMQEYSNLGRDSKTLIIHYAAEGFAVNDGTTSHSNICTWYIAPPGPRSCTITFSLNPTTYTTTLTKDGAMVTNDATNQPQTSTSQSFVFTRNQPSFNDSGNYTLRINNGIFENTFIFYISAINEGQPTTTITPATGGTPPPIPPPDNLGVIIGAAVGGVVAFLLIIILAVYCLKMQINKIHQDKEVTGRSNIGMEAEHGYYEVANLSAYQNEHVTNNIPATQSTNYENLKDNVNVTRDERGYVDIQSVGPSIVTTSNDGYEVFIRRNNENTAGNQQNESQYEHVA
nr:uncharacterized protein LOC100178478 isoform X3 [Ciona intestinalis]|eukprot:XP_026695340.1 uncharacterized protein LOC100178478 isoform X3 [Ciona intestinalis]